MWDLQVYRHKREKITVVKWPKLSTNKNDAINLKKCCQKCNAKSDICNLPVNVKPLSK